MRTKICIKCYDKKLLDDFGTNRRYGDEKERACKGCLRKYHHELAERRKGRPSLLKDGPRAENLSEFKPPDDAVYSISISRHNKIVCELNDRYERDIAAYEVRILEARIRG